MKTVTITKEDYNKARSVPWNPRTCILAQVAIRLGAKPGSDEIVDWIGKLISDPRADEAMTLFDRGHRNAPRYADSLAKLEAMLPIKVRL